MSRESGDVAAPSRADDLLTLARLSVGRDAVRAILDWLGRRTGGLALLVRADRKVLAGPADRLGPGTPLSRAVGAAVADLSRRGSSAAVVDTAGPARVHLLRLGGGDPDRSAAALVARAEEQIGYLVVVAAAERQLGELLADTARTLSLCWRVEEADRARRRIAAADAHGREAVLHLLMVGDVPPARRIASALRPQLPEALRVCVIECVGRQRYEVAAEIDRSLAGRAWIVPCPVRSNHLIALVPAEPSGGDAPTPSRETGQRAAGRADPADRLGRLITARARQCRVGMSEPVALPETASGYEQAFHALAVARAATGYARFDRQHDLAPLTGPDGYAWAQRLLQPCLDHRPARRADPGAAELLGTLNSWLAFDSAASRHLKIHRNTLAGRLRLLNTLLGLDLLRIRDRSAAWLALRLRDAPRPQSPEPGTPRPQSTGPGTPRPQITGPDTVPAGAAPASREVTLDHLLAAPAVTAWARTRLGPLRPADRSTGFETVRAWLAADTSLAATSTVLGVSVSATRKRLARAEQALGRSLLHAPDARHELWLAIRALELAEG
ncbi:helix-turn-helix domain-containing protein [Plantactinospora veratri]|uniref:Helix-turn-helix domain-containing protein n=1 Tax=Plantactinospora veratri TaxID=1436122 RepID=A0ABU7SJS9_9ACTN